MRTHLSTKIRLAIGVVVIFSLILPNVALAAPIVIDHFSDGDPLTLTVTGGQTFGFSGNTTAIGGERDLILSSTGGTSDAVLDPTHHFLDFVNRAGVTSSSLRIQYDGADQSTTLNPVGLGGVNLVSGTNIGFHIEVVYNNHPVNLTLTVYTDATHWSQNTLPIPGDINPQNHVDFFMRFSQLENSPFQGPDGMFDKTNVGAIVLVLSASTPGEILLDLVEASNKEDYGDLPVAYGNASHVPNGMRLGSNLDTEPFSYNVLPAHTTDALGDDNENGVLVDDEDGIVRTPNINWRPGLGGGSVDVTVKGCQSDCVLNAWFDWNNDLDFNDLSENAITDYPLINGTQTITFDIPAGTIINNGTFYSRFRLFSSDTNGLATPTGDVLGGEVEDYQWIFGPTAVTLASLQAHTNPTSTIMLGLILGILICASIILTYTFWHSRRA